jgi:hypothetical protein
LKSNITLTGKAKEFLRPASDSLQPSDSTDLFDQVEWNKEPLKPTK